MKRLRQILTVFVVGLTFLVMQAFGYGALQAQASDTLESPQGIYYKGVPGEAKNVNSTDKLRFNDNETNNVRNDNNPVENARKNLKETANNVRESVSGNVGEDVISPEGKYYKAVPNEGNYSKDNRLARDARNSLRDASGNVKSTADNIREKLNLDEELPRSTKDFFQSTKEKVEDVVKPLTGNR